jgi:hypothetical protein
VREVDGLDTRSGASVRGLLVRLESRQLLPLWEVDGKHQEACVHLPELRVREQEGSVLQAQVTGLLYQRKGDDMRPSPREKTNHRKFYHAVHPKQANFTGQDIHVSGCCDGTLGRSWSWSCFVGLFGAGDPTLIWGSFGGSAGWVAVVGTAAVVPARRIRSGS